MDTEKNHKDEDQLHWEALRMGDTGAFSSLYQSYSKLLLSYGRKVHNDRQLVADSVQELFTYLWTRRAHLGETASVKFYLIKALRTIIVKEVNKNKTVELKLSDSKVEVHDSREFQLIAEEQSHEQKKMIKEALDNLSKREQEILYLKYFAGTSNEEISNLLDIKYQSVKNVSASAIKKLRKNLADGGASVFITLNILISI